MKPQQQQLLSDLNMEQAFIISDVNWSIKEFCRNICHKGNKLIYQRKTFKL